MGWHVRLPRQPLRPCAERGSPCPSDARDKYVTAVRQIFSLCLKKNLEFSAAQAGAEVMQWHD
jgi:hypothetical protein